MLISTLVLQVLMWTKDIINLPLFSTSFNVFKHSIKEKIKERASGGIVLLLDKT